MIRPTPQELAGMIDHTLIRPTATQTDIIKLCQEARDYRFCAACVPPIYVPLAVQQLKDTGVKVGTVVGFPLGYQNPEVKLIETALALREGARDIDMVMNIAAMKSGDFSLVKKDIEGVVRAAAGATVKVILETCYLTEAEKLKACEILVEAGARFAKTSTGLAEGGATVEDVRLLRNHLPHRIGVKAAGGIRDCQTALAMIEAGANRIGTSTGPAIIDSCKLLAE
jgi:deoxyribose-phosphate aldolase